MIPDYLKGKTAPQILGETMALHRHKADENYIEILEHHLLMAILHALCAADGTADEPHAEGRAIAFLNEVLPSTPGQETA